MTDPGLLRLFLEKRPQLLRMLTARLGSVPEAEDALQDLYLRLKTAHPNQDIQNPNAFLYRSALNAAADRIRSASRDRRRAHAYAETTTTTAPGLDLLEERPDPEAAVIARDALTRLMGAVESLPPQTRRVFKLHKIDGLSHSEVATSLGISRSAVEKHMMAALKTLSNFMYSLAPPDG